MKWRIVFVPLSLVIIGIIRLIKPWVRVRFGEVWTNRLGHLVGNTECYLSERDSGMHKGCFDIWFKLPGPVSHPLIWRKYKRFLHTVPRWFGELLVITNRMFYDFDAHVVASLQFDRDVRNLWEGPHLRFTKWEEMRGKQLLHTLGIPKGAKWVALIVRDADYLKQYGGGSDFSYHDHRDSDISTYQPAVLELIRRGYYVVRLGKVAAKPLLVQHSRVIDYAFRKDRSDFGNFYLAANCAFAVGASTGIMSIPQVFQRPTAIVNFVPLEYIHTWLEGLVLWKHHVKDGKRMSIKEIIDSGAGQFMFHWQFQASGITLEDNTSDEILDAVKEMCDGIERGTQPEMWSKFPLGSISNYNKERLHGEVRVRIGREFMKEYA